MQLTDKPLLCALQLGGLSMLRDTYAPAEPGACTLLVSSGFRVVFPLTRSHKRLVGSTSLEVNPQGAAFVKHCFLALRHHRVQDVTNLALATHVAFEGYRVEPDAALAV